MNTTLTLIDKITHKAIDYNANDIFTLKTKSGHNRYIIRKAFAAKDLQIALDEFYSLVIPEGHYKYIFRHPEGRHHHKGELILRMKGYPQPITSSNQASLRDVRIPKKYDVQSLVNLNNCPRTLAQELSSLHKGNFPASLTRWTYQKITYCLLAHFVALTDEERYFLLQSSEELFNQHKIKSGETENSDKIVRVNVVVNEDLL